MLVKTAVSVWLLQIPSVGIYGAVAAASVGYATSFLLDLFFALRATKGRVEKSAGRVEKSA
jgi:ribosomal protein L9